MVCEYCMCTDEWNENKSVHISIMQHRVCYALEERVRMASDISVLGQQKIAYSGEN